MSIQDWRNRLIRTSQFPYFNYDEFTFDKEKKTFPMAMICLLIDDDLMIAVGCDPLSPMDFRAKYPDSIFKIDFSIPPRTTITMYGDRTIYYATKAG